MRGWSWFDIFAGIMLVVLTLTVVYLLGASIYMINDCLMHANSRWC